MDGNCTVKLFIRIKEESLMQLSFYVGFRDVKSENS